MKYLCKCRIHLHNRPRPCRTRRIILVRTSPRACRTRCGSSALPCRRHRPDNSRSRPGRSVCSAASPRTAPRRICPGSSPRTWRWSPTAPHPAPGGRRAPRPGAETSLDELSGGWGGRSRGADHLWVTPADWPELHRLPGVFSIRQVCFAHDLPSSISSFRCCRPFCQPCALFRNPVGEVGLAVDSHPGTGVCATWCHKLSLVCLCEWRTEPQTAAGQWSDFNRIS